MFRKFLVCACVGIGFSVHAIGQADANALRQLSLRRSANFAAQRTTAARFARRRGLPMNYVDAEGNTVHLVGLLPSGIPIYLTTFNANAAITTNVTALRAGGTLGLNLAGDEMSVGVWDGGRVKQHVELDTRLISTEGSTYDTHATHVTGTLIASGVNPAAKGMAPHAKANTNDFLDDEAEMAALATSQLLSNHSYGTVTGWQKNGTQWDWKGDPSVSPIEDYRFGFYDTRAQTIDQIAVMAPYYTIVWAAGNDRADVGNGSKPADCNGGSGYDCIIPDAVAKNVITVGAVDKVLSYTNAFDVSMSFFSSWGPTDDGRIKPDLVADGINLFSLSAVGTDGYTTLSGTSMATPNVTGSLLLLQQLYGKIHGGTRMKASTLKALAIHTAREAGPSPGPDYSFGWGLLDAGAAGRVIEEQDNESTYIIEDTVTNDFVFQLPLHPKANQKITATLAWTDPAGIPVSPSLDPTAIMLVNDLDLRIADDQGHEQLPWVLDPANPSKAAVHGDNFRDNVEKLEFDLPEGRDYLLRVKNKGTLLAGSQNFSLIVSYQPLNSQRVLYWIGDSGDWNSGQHWSFSSGGSAANLVPVAGDRAIVDENSFDGLGSDNITLSQDAAVGELYWLNSKASSIQFQGHTLNITEGAVMPEANFSATGGQIHFNGSGSVVLHDVSFGSTSVLFDGDWKVAGNFSTQDLDVRSGSLSFSDSHVTLSTCVSHAGNPRKITLSNATIAIAGGSDWEGDGLTVRSENGIVDVVGSDVTLTWNQVDFPGEVRSGNGNKLTIGGDNRIGTLNSAGVLSLNGSNKIDTLNVAAGSDVSLGPSTNQSLRGQINLASFASSPIHLHSTGIATFTFADHVKLCFDYLKVENVNVAGSAVVSAGANSVLSNSANWRSGACGDALFADFSMRYICVNSLSEFTNTSTGPASTFSWRFDNGQALTSKDATWKFAAAGVAQATLKVTGAGQVDSVTRSINIQSNPLPLNKVFFNNDILTSFVIEPRYQWYNNGVAIAGATSRSLQWDEVAGAFWVVAYADQCNTVSDTLAITGLEPALVTDVFPNPASSKVVVGIPQGGAKMSLRSMIGAIVWEGATVDKTFTIPVNDFPDGIYLLTIRHTEGEEIRKIVIDHYH